MVPELVWRPQARADLLAIFLDIGKEHPGAAERYFDAIEARASQLVQHPRMGRRRPDIAPAARMLVERPYLILYATEPDTEDGEIERVRIVRVVDGRRGELPGLFAR